MEKVTITFDNGWELSFPVLVVDLVIGVVAAAIMIRAVIRWVNNAVGNTADPGKVRSPAPAPDDELTGPRDVKRRVSDAIFRCARTGYVTAVVSSALMWLCAFWVATPLKAYPGSRFFHEVSPILLGLLFCFLLFGAVWSEFSERASRSKWIRRCVYFSFGFLVFAVLKLVIRPM